MIKWRWLKFDRSYPRRMTLCRLEPVFRGRAYKALAFVMFVGFFGLPPLRAGERDENLFAIHNIHVDISAKDAATARALAIEEAEEKAYNSLIIKLTQPEDRGRLPEISKIERQLMMSGIEINHEQNSPKRYVAVLDIRFVPELVSGFLARHGVPHILASGAGLIALHGHQDGLTRQLWGDLPARKAALEKVDWQNRLRRYIWPKATLKERLFLTADQFFAFDGEAALKLASEYGLDEALMIQTFFTNDRDEKGHIGKALNYDAYLPRSGRRFQGHITLPPYPAGQNFTNSSPANAPSAGAEITDRQTILVAQEPDIQDYFAAAYAEIFEAVDKEWRGNFLIDLSLEGQMTFLVPALNLEDWVFISQKLSRVSLVQKYQVENLALPLGQVRVEYAGTKEQFFLALKEEGLKITMTEMGLLIERDGA